MSTERKEDKAMTNNDARKAHKILDDLFKRKPVLDEEREFLRNALPELPKQKTLEEISVEVEGLCGLASGTEGYLPIGGMGVRPRLEELHAQLKGLKDEPTAVPALPAGMRLADHEEYGRVVTSPKPDQDGVYVLLAPRPKVETGADWEYAHECELTFIDAEPAKPTHPEFLETEADYESAPEGTIAACEDSPPLHKSGSAWLSAVVYGGNRAKSMAGVTRRILRWGWGE